MSYNDYIKSREIAIECYPFYALVMAAIRQADSTNLLRLKIAFPVVFEEFQQRYAAPGGLLPDELE